MSSTFRPYETCRFSDELAVVDVGDLGEGVQARPVKTRTGTESLPLKAGRRIMFAYPNTDFFANTKVEILPEQNYAASKDLVLRGFDYTLASDDSTTRNYTLHSPEHGFEIHGLDRKSLQGGVLGVYLLIAESQRAVTTIYFLNQEPERRHFSTYGQYVSLRDAFLDQYTSCIRANQQQTTSTEVKPK